MNTARQALLMLLFLALGVPVFSQNILPNPSFGIRDCCPQANSAMHCCRDWEMVNSSVEYVHYCTTNPTLIERLEIRPPRTDSAIVASVFGAGAYREYFGCWLPGPLLAGKTYCLSFWIAISPYSHRTVDRYQVLFTTDKPVQNYPPLPSYILDSAQFTHYGYITETDVWTQISGSFVADGSEAFMTFGVFDPLDSIKAIVNSTGLTDAYYFIDDVALYPCDAPVDSANAGPDVFFCTGDSVQLGTHALPEYRYYWYIDTVLVSREARPVFAPTQTTTYTLLVKEFKFDESRDTVTAHWVNCDTIPLGCDQKEILVCLGDSVQLGCHHKSNYTYAWQQLPDTTIISTQGFLTAGDQAASYVLHMTDYTRRSQSDTIEVIPVDCAPIGQGSGGSYEICPGDTLLLGQESLPGASYAWYAPALLPDSTSLIRVSPQASTTYQLVVENPRKDQFVFHYRVTIGECDIPLFVPNAFTPDGDGLNDVFEIGMPPGTHLEMLIFNRWGNHLFTANQHRFWDGTYNGVDVPSGVYYYSLTATLPPYRTTRLQGTVMVLRGQ